MANECQYLEHEIVMRGSTLHLDYHRCGLTHVKCVGERNCPIYADEARRNGKQKEARDVRA